MLLALSFLLADCLHNFGSCLSDQPPLARLEQKVITQELLAPSSCNRGIALRAMDDGILTDQAILIDCP